MVRFCCLCLVPALALAAAGCGTTRLCPREMAPPPLDRLGAKRDEENPQDKAKDGKDGRKKKKEDKEKNGKDEKKEEEKGKTDRENCGCAEKKPAKTIFEWAIGKEEEKKKCNDRENSNDRENGNGSGNGDGSGNGGEEEQDIIETDRPDFTEASSTVGRGRIQLEAGYTFTRDAGRGGRLNAHSYPEMLWRIGMFAEWFELRIEQNFWSTTETANGRRASNSGADDLVVGVKLALTEQKGWLPETAVILDMSVPSGAKAFTSGQVEPGIDLLYGWDIIKDCLTLGGSTLLARARGDLDDAFLTAPASTLLVPAGAQDHPFLEIAQSLTVGCKLTRKLGAYTEWFALFPHSATDPNIGPEYYLDGGFTCKVTNNFQLDIRAGVGLNDHADNYFAGSGFAVRY